MTEPTPIAPPAPLLGDAAPLLEPQPLVAGAGASAQDLASVPVARLLPPAVLLWALSGLVVLLCFTVVLLWQRVANMQEVLARQSADATANSVEAKTLARSAQDLVREANTRYGLLETKVAESALQRSQLEELMQSLSRSRDENLLVDIEAALRLAQQQAVLTGTVEPMLAALKSADQRIARAAQPRLVALQRAISKDIERMKVSTHADVPGLLVKLDELVRNIDELPMANAVGLGSAAAPSVPGAAAREQPLHWWTQAWSAVRAQANSLLRISRIDAPDASLVAPEQAWMLRENLKLKLLNARLGVLARQLDAARADLGHAQIAIGKYFDASSRKTQTALALLAQTQAQLRTTELPQMDASLAALGAATASR